MSDSLYMLRRLRREPLPRRLPFAPGLRRDFGDLPVGHVRQSCEDVAKISERIQPASAAVFDDGINDGAALAGFGLADEEPVLLADGRGADGVFHQIIVDLNPAVF